MSKEENEFDKLLNKFPTNVSLDYGRSEGGDPVDPFAQRDRSVAIFGFSEKGFGFGLLTVTQTKDGCFIDTEHMGREKVKKLFSIMIDNAITDVDNDPQKHALFNSVVGRSCGEGCSICYPEKTRYEVR